MGSVVSTIKSVSTQYLHTYGLKLVITKVFELKMRVLKFFNEYVWKEKINFVLCVFVIEKFKWNLGFYNCMWFVRKLNSLVFRLSFFFFLSTYLIFSFHDIVIAKPNIFLVESRWGVGFRKFSSGILGLEWSSALSLMCFNRISNILKKNPLLWPHQVLVWAY